jgi:hypothetical protein
MSNLKIYNEYKKYGVDGYYKKYANTYFNPHENKINNILIDIIKNIYSNSLTILDIACGNGLVSKIINNYLLNNKLENNNIIIEGTDPYFNNKYCNYNYSFEDIANGLISNKKYNIGFCCYAFHLLNKSWYYQFFNELANIVDEFIIITPSKKINIKHNLWKKIKHYRTKDKITVIILKNYKN